MIQRQYSNLTLYIESDESKLPRFNPLPEKNRAAEQASSPVFTSSSSLQLHLHYLSSFPSTSPPPTLHQLFTISAPPSQLQLHGGSSVAVVEPAPVPVGTLVSRAGGSLLLYYISPLPQVRLCWLLPCPHKGSAASSVNTLSNR